MGGVHEGDGAVGLCLAHFQVGLVWVGEFGKQVEGLVKVGQGLGCVAGECGMLSECGVYLGEVAQAGYGDG